MAKNEEGEFELVLGNRQLISVFLIVVILLGVFFSMGYIVGRNSAPGAGSELARNAKPAAEQPADTSASASSPPVAAQPAPTPAAESKPPASDQAATHPEQPAPAAETPPAKPAPSAPAKAKEKKPAAPPAAPSEPASVTGQPSPGQYWQVVATARPDAEIVAEALGRKGMHAIIAPAPKEGFFRVLVGPLPDAATQAQTRTQLEAAGFKNPIVRKY